MTNLEFSCILFLVSYSSGLFGALTGLGGGIIIVPVLVLLFGIDIRFAMGASLISVIATSSAAALTFIRNHYTNIKIGMFLETGAVFGAIIGAFLVRFISVDFISILLGAVLILSVWLSRKRYAEQTTYDAPSHPWALRLGLEESYKVYQVPFALGLLTIAGGLSGLLGIGSGALKVLAMDLAMKLPYKVATSTSNFMIGITAAASIGIYFSAGYMNPELSFPVMLGVLAGAFMGSKLLLLVHVRNLRTLFNCIVLILALQLLYKGITGTV